MFSYKFDFFGCDFFSHFVWGFCFYVRMHCKEVRTFVYAGVCEKKKILSISHSLGVPFFGGYRMVHAPIFSTLVRYFFLPSYQIRTPFFLSSFHICTPFFLQSFYIRTPYFLSSHTFFSYHRSVFVNIFSYQPFCVCKLFSYHPFCVCEHFFLSCLAPFFLPFFYILIPHLFSISTSFFCLTLARSQTVSIITSVKAVTL